MPISFTSRLDDAFARVDAAGDGACSSTASFAKDRGALELLTRRLHVPQRALARHYASRTSRARTSDASALDPNGIRAGLLGQGSILHGDVHADRTSPSSAAMDPRNFSHLTAPPAPERAGLKPSGEAGHGVVDARIGWRSIGRPVAPAATRSVTESPVARKPRRRGQAAVLGESSEPIDGVGSAADGTKLWARPGSGTRCSNNRIRSSRRITEKLLTYALGRGSSTSTRRRVRAIVREARGQTIASRPA